MATQDNKAHKTSSQVPAPNTQSAQDLKKQIADTKTGHTYDPVGMAGQKAGIVEQIQQELGQEDRETTESAAAAGNANSKA